MADDLDLQRFKTYAIGGNPLVKGDAKVLAFTVLDRDRRLAVAYVNPDNLDAAAIPARDYLPAVVLRIKEKRGWDYRDYDLYVSPPRSPDYERVRWSRDPDTGEPTFGTVNVFVKEEEMVRLLNSFRASDGAIPHFHDADMSQFDFSPSPQTRSDRAFTNLRNAPPPQPRHDIRSFAEYATEGYPPVATAATFFDGRHRMAIVYANPENPSSTPWQVYTGELAATIQQRRGWEYGQYDLFVKQYPHWPVQQVTFTRDPTGTLTMSSQLERVDDDVMNATIRSFPVTEPAHIHSLDLVGYHVHPSLDVE